MPKPSSSLLAATLLLAVLSAGAILAQDVAGAWTITVQTKPQPTVDAQILLCQWTGIWELMESAGQVTGTVTLELDPTAMNDDGCPATMTAMIGATNDAGTIKGTIGGPKDPLGEVSFTGMVAVDGGSTAASVRTASTSASGSFSVVGGQYSLNAGSWSGTRAPVMPTLPSIGLILLLLALLAGGSFLLLRRPAA